MSEQLTQEQIDALTNGANLNNMLTSFEIDTVGELGNISMGSGATTLSLILNKAVNITTPTVSPCDFTDLLNEFRFPLVLVEVKYTVGLEHSNVFLLKPEDASIICDLMMGGDGTNPTAQIGEMELSAVGEAMNQMMGAAATSMSTFFGHRVDISPPQISFMTLKDDPLARNTLENEDLCRISFNMTVEGLINSQLVQVLPTKSVKKLVEALVSASDNTKTAEAQEKAGLNVKAEAPKPPAPQAPPAPPAPQQPVAAAIPPAPPVQTAPPVAPQPTYAQEARLSVPQSSPFQQDPAVPVRQAAFSPLSSPGGAEGISGLDLIMDVPLKVTVELGRTKMQIRDVLDLGKGSVVELDTLVGEPVSMLVNGKLIAKGEVVVIDENFGIRVTDIVSPIERFNSLKLV
jgi:flagellar motor switch protein FliN